jgi:thiamine-phosphate diphosphorylase
VAGALRTMVVTSPDAPFAEVLRVCDAALRGGADAVLLRRPGATARALFELARALRPLTRAAGASLLVHDRGDVAVAAGADGLHLAARSLPLAAARRAVASTRLIGASVHNLDEAGQAEEEGADYLLLGPVFSTRSHPDRAPLGIETYREAVLRARVPVLAIGGVDAERVAEVARAGGRGAAAISAFFDAADPALVARRFRAAFGS